MKKKRNYALDLLKIIACYCVIINHTNSHIFLNFYPQVNGIISLVYFILCKMGVPIFFMVSGALLLRKEESYKDWFHHRVLRFGIVLVAISFIANWVQPGSLGLASFILQFMKEPILIPYWYLYTYLGIVLALPFLRKMIKGMEKKDVQIYLLIAILISSFYPFVNGYLHLPAISGYVITTIFSGPLMYFVLGHYLANVHCKETSFHTKKENSIGISLFLISFCVLYLLFAKEYADNGEFLLSLDNAYYFPYLCMSGCLFYLCYRNMQSVQLNVTGKIISCASSYTFGIYLFHPVFQSYPSFNQMYSILSANMNDLMATFLYQGLLIIACVLATFICKKLPYIKTLM